MSDNLYPNADRAIAYLQWLCPETPLYVERMESSGPERPKAKIYQTHEADSAKRFVTTNNGENLQRNMFYLPNAEFLKGRRAKANVSASRFVWADLDCKDFLGNLEQQQEAILGPLTDNRLRPKGVPKPTAIVFTGGGYQAVWRFASPIPPEQAEDMNKALLVAFGGAPGPVAVSQLLRLPETVNWLNDGKREAGREPAKALLFDPVKFGRPPVSYGIEDFKLRISNKTGIELSGRSAAALEAAELEPLSPPDNLAELLPSNPDWAEAIATGNNPSGKTYPTRSELVFAALRWMLGNDVSPSHALAIILDTNYGIGAHVREQPNPLQYARRQVLRALLTIEAQREDWPEVTKEGHPVESHPANIRYALARLGVDARRNMFVLADEVSGLGLEERDLNDIGDILASRFRLELHFKASSAAIKSEIVAVAHEQSYHPVIEYLESLKWDGTPRLDTWLRDLCGAEDSELNGEFGAKMLIAGVRRIRQPGIKFDTMLVLEGEQGTGKSSLVEALAVREEWFCASLNLNADAKTQAEMMRRVWVVECQELDGARKATMDAVKSFLSTPADMYRPAFGRNAGHFPRHCVIFGTTNEDLYLRDPTGNRRFWPVKIREIDIDRLRANVDQLWAEAAKREAEGESIILSRHLWDAAAELQGLRMVEDAFASVLEDWFSERSGRVSMDSVKLLLGYEGGRMLSGESQRLQMAMSKLGWEYKSFRLYDLGQTECTPRKGFAKGTPEARKTEWMATRVKGGVVALVEVRNKGRHDVF